MLTKSGHQKGQHSYPNDLKRHADLDHVADLNAAAGEPDDVRGRPGGEDVGKLGPNGPGDHEEQRVDAHGLGYLNKQWNDERGRGVVRSELRDGTAHQAHRRRYGPIRRFLQKVQRPRQYVGEAAGPDAISNGEARA